MHFTRFGDSMIPYRTESSYVEDSGAYCSKIVVWSPQSQNHTGDYLGPYIRV